ncbi:MAG: hypothetical protein J5950_04315, partial [Clostridia bacterium]|nr:hypothetical protein [Clostridia bacterium]
MNDNDISKIIKQMPEDLIEESSEFAGKSAGKKQKAKKRTGGGFFRNPAFSVAVSVLLFVISAAVVTGIMLGRRNARSNDVIQPGGVDISTDAGADVAASTSTPAPEYTLKEPVLTDFTGAVHGDVYDFGILEMNDNTDRTDFLNKWEVYVKELFKDMENAAEQTAEMLEYCEKLNISATSGKGYWMDISPRGIKGIGQIFRYDGVLPSDGDKSFRLDVLFADGEIRHVFSDNLSERTVYSIVPFYINNRETPGLLASTIASDGIGLDYAIFAYDPEIGKVTEISPSVYNRALFVVKNRTASYVLDTRSWMGGEVEFDGSDMTIGGVTPYEFFTFLFDYSRENTTTPDPLSTQTAPYPETPTPTPEHTPVKTEVPTPAPTPGPTPIPRDDPSSLWYISSHSSSMTVANIDGGFDHRAGIDKGVLYL